MTPKRKHMFMPLRTALVPVVYGCDCAAALAAAHAVAEQVVLIGVVHIPPDESLSAGTSHARDVRKLLRQHGSIDGVRGKAGVIVSHTPWDDLAELIGREQPDLLVLEWDCSLEALGVSPAEVLTQPLCDIALVRGPLPDRPERVLVALRGGPHAELALRAGLSLRPRDLTALHLTAQAGEANDAAFRGLDRVLRRLPGVHVVSSPSADTPETILQRGADADLIVMGVTGQPVRGRSLGPVVDRVMRESTVPVMALKTHRPAMPAHFDETSGAQAISILVDKWFAENTFDADEFADIEHLLALKRKAGVTVSLALPALNEQATVGKVIATVKGALMDDAALLDEIVLIDSDSTDRTREIAAGLGVPVYIHQHILPEMGARRGKGEALWKSLLVTRGDIIAWIDTDIENIRPRFVYGILGPLLLNQGIQFVKGFYRRPLKVGDQTQAGGGGRVTELTARPMLNLFYPELSGIIQPLSGEYAGRRSALEQLPFFSGYGVETGLLIDVCETFGLQAIAQVDLLERVHHNQPLDALSKMSFAILQAVIRKLERRYGRQILDDVNKSMKLIRHDVGGYFLDVEEIVERERPPMISLPEYAARLAEQAG